MTINLLQMYEANYPEILKACYAINGRCNNNNYNNNNIFFIQILIICFKYYYIYFWFIRVFKTRITYELNQ